MKLASKASDALYPDLIAGGGLANALQSALRGIRSSLTVSELDVDTGFVCARVESGPRFCQVYMAADERLFMFDFWARGVELAHANTPHLAEMAGAIDKWVASACSTAELVAAFKFVAIEKQTPAFEAGEEVEERWQEMFRDSFPVNPELVLAAYQRAQLRQLFPFTSMDRLHFSRCTGYPYTLDLPYVFPLLDQYVVARRSEVILGRGNVEEAIELVLANLPPNCGPAVPGTADDMVDAEPD